MTAIVTDSAASLPRELASELGIEVVPLYLTFGDRSYRDGVDINDFYGHLRRHDAAVTTSTPSPGDFLEAFGRVTEDEVVCVTVASGVSAVHGAATAAAQMTSRRVEVVDSGNASMAEGFVALEAARAARAGAGLEEVAARAREVAARARLLATIDTFEYLRKSGRVNRLLAYAGTMLHIKPVFRFRQGGIDPVGRPRTRRRALDLIVDEAAGEVGDRPVHLAAVHADAEAEAKDLVDRVAARTQVVESLIAEFTPAMGAHTGPGVVGLAYFWD